VAELTPKFEINDAVIVHGATKHSGTIHAHIVRRVYNVNFGEWAYTLISTSGDWSTAWERDLTKEVSRG
jgi:hypothetical protein